MGVSVTVYYKGGSERVDELSDTLARIRRRAAALPAGRKLDVAEERISNVEERIKEMDAKDADDAMRSKFHQDMRAMARLCSTAVRAPVSLEYREPDESTPGSLVWLFRSDPATGIKTVARIMESAGLKGVDSYVMGAIALRHDFDLDNLTASGCNRIRLATENAARALWKEYRGEKANDQIEGGFHSDERQIPFEGARQYGAVRAAFLAVAGVRYAGEGRGLAHRSAGGLHMGSGEWLMPHAESVLWIRETMKWINREGRTDRGELEAQIGARVGNEPSRDADLFDQASSAITSASCGRFDGKALEPMKEE